MTLVDATGEVVVRDLAADEARGLTVRIRSTVVAAWDLVCEAYDGRVWLALGYESWDAYCSAELDGAAIRLPREQRQETVRSLRDAGLSQRAIASAVGVDHRTVGNDLRSGGENSPPDDPEPGDEADDEPPPITGTDGKTYKPNAPKPKPPKPPKDRRRPLADAYQTATSDLTRCVDRLVKLTEDDRYRTHQEDLTRRYGSDLLRSIAATTAAIARLDPAGFPDGREARQWCLASLQATTETLQRLAASIRS